MSLPFDPSQRGVVHEVLEFLGAAPNRTLGQNFLVNPGALEKIVATANVQKGDTVLEVGSGLGALTVRLVRDAGTVVAVEKDAKFAAFLPKQLPSLRLIHGDALELSWDELELPNEGVKIVANLPYSISKPILRRFLEEWRSHLTSATILVQREVADRLVAPPNSREYGPMSLMAQLYCRATKAFEIAPGSFLPPPDVTSTVVHLEILPQPSLELEDEAYFWHVVRAAFAQRRKTLNNTLKVIATRDALQSAFAATQIDPMRRGETLSLREFADLAAILNPKPQSSNFAESTAETVEAETVEIDS